MAHTIFDCLGNILWRGDWRERLAGPLHFQCYVALIAKMTGLPAQRELAGPEIRKRNHIHALQHGHHLKWKALAGALFVKIRCRRKTHFGNRFSPISEPRLASFIDGEAESRRGSNMEHVRRNAPRQ